MSEAMSEGEAIEMVRRLYRDLPSDVSIRALSVVSVGVERKAGAMPEMMAEFWTAGGAHLALIGALQCAGTQVEKRMEEHYQVGVDSLPYQAPEWKA